LRNFKEQNNRIEFRQPGPEKCIVTSRTIDGHRHVMCLEAHQLASSIDPVKANAMAGAGQASAVVNLEKAPEWFRKMSDFDEHIADMDAAGIDVGVIWPPPPGFYYWAEPSDGLELARLVNSNTAKICHAYPERFVGLASVPLQEVGMAVEELKRGVGELQFRGAAIASNINGLGLDDERFLPFFKQAETLDVPVFIHPDVFAPPERMSKYYLVNFLGYPMDTALAACELVFGGILDACPNLKVCLVHSGGALPALLGRLEHGQSVRPEAREKCRHPFPYYLKNFYVDSVAFRPEILELVIRVMPEGHVFMGTDYPFDMAEPDPVSAIKAAVSDGEAILPQILGESLARLIKL
jgi:aminocarboxymuconate-semialdehyde decarboxylase